MTSSIYDHISKGSVYKPLTLEGLKETIKRLEGERPHNAPTVIYTSRRGMLTMNLFTWSHNTKIKIWFYQPVRIPKLLVLSLFQKHGLCQIRVKDTPDGYSYMLYYGSTCYGYTASLEKMIYLIYDMKTQLLKQNIQL